MKVWKAVALVSVVAAQLLPAWDAEAGYPERPVTIIVAFDAGGGTDLLMRAFAPFLEKQLGSGARIHVTNKPGASGEIGFAALADSAPDGYTLGAINSPTVNAIPIERQARYSLDRLDPLYNLVDDPSALAVRQDSRFRTLADLAAFARANPGKVTVGTTGIGSDDHLAMLAFQRRAGLALDHMPFQGSAVAEAALISQRIMVSAVNIGEAMQFKRKDPITVLGVMSGDRVIQAPDVATFQEQGYDIRMSSLRGIAAPKGLAPDIRAKLVDAIAKAAHDPAFQAKARDLFQPLRLLPPERYATALTEATEDLRRLWSTDPWLE
ncbi:tripartite tricarboxylate transporter substrate binding protein [Azospirillum picis]|uniref:Tripartite-type tricarboxylate transporter receptor subunit TctC n=1 Tax=Azospirillum picis TaxID=488438 RepID=A0ABU0MR53_9PROT|nr:tripartite tricarboxylate transporter substrate binding protein [Azospirillum picis]MBP2302373.1 tripartite-type tricarboxylate transporter receptor subunit TctC [Azospirillum picis]MDQ0535952.1 tripartite-type tricarboxylate transporter receptor subunit TctC [Azospirillum picis]